MQAVASDGLAERDSVGRGKSSKAAQDGELRAQHVAFRTSCKNAAGSLFGKSGGVVGDQSGHGRRHLRAVVICGGEFAGAQQRGLERVDLGDDVGEIGHHFLLVLKRSHEALAGHAGREERDLP